MTSLFTNHGAVLLALARRPDLRIRDIAAEVGITERSVQGILSELTAEGYLERTRVGRRNHYVLQGDMPLPQSGDHEMADLFRALVSDTVSEHASERRRAVVLACSDYRFQEPLQHLLSAEGLSGRAEIFLWPGGSAALGGAAGPALLAEMVQAAGAEASPRVVLVAHQGCHARGAYVVPKRDPLETGRAVLRRRSKGIERAQKAFGVEPELWFLGPNGAHRLRAADRANSGKGRGGV